MSHGKSRAWDHSHSAPVQFWPLPPSSAAVPSANVLDLLLLMMIYLLIFMFPISYFNRTGEEGAGYLKQKGAQHK